MDKASTAEEWEFYQDHTKWYWRCHKMAQNNEDLSQSCDHGFDWLTDCLRDAKAHGYRHIKCFEAASTDN